MKRLLQFILFLFILDYVLDYFYWKLPNESPWSTNHFYSFEYELKKLSKEDLSDTVLILGSSLAVYSFDAIELEHLLENKFQRKIRVKFLSYAGMTPLDAFLLSEKLISLNPLLVVYPINFIDLRLHRTYVLDPSSSNRDFPEQRLLLDALKFSEAPQSKFHFPFSTVKHFWKELGSDLSSIYLLSSILNSYRYRELVYENIRNLFNHRFGRNTSYHGYYGVQIPERVNTLGWTGKEFSFKPISKMFSEGFLIQVVPEILQSGPLKISIVSNGKVQEVLFTQTGWKKIILDKKFLNQELVTCKLSSTWKPVNASEDRFDYAREDLGVRLTQTFGLENSKSDYHFIREERSEDLRFGSMSDKEYEEYFYYRLLSNPEKRPGIGYLYALKNAKERIAKEEFVPVLHLKYLKLFAKEFHNAKTKLVIINNPENPISLGWYVNSNWYKGYLQYLQELNSYSYYFDLHKELPMQSFSDYHHFTYKGMQAMTNRYLEIIASALK
ncbi:MAG: hypothetical protein SFU98_21505 [Leptospiraceae bacterium]|nr:hypothetical protein [Leptospiraceae bacterium]